MKEETAEILNTSFFLNLEEIEILEEFRDKRWCSKHQVEEDHDFRVMEKNSI